MITIDIAQQQLYLDGAASLTLPISSALAGVSEQAGSGGTPSGLHLIRARFGDGLPPTAVFQGRRFTGDVYSAELAQQYPERDWILGRILWLGGLEPGRNQGGEVDTFRRFIYLHGTPDDQPMGEPASHGCIRLRPSDMVRLFQSVHVGDRVLIT